MKYTQHTIYLRTITLLTCALATHSAMGAPVTRSISSRSIQALETKLAELGLPTESLDLEQCAFTRRRQGGLSPQELQQASAQPSDRVVSESIRRTRSAIQHKKAKALQGKTEQRRLFGMARKAVEKKATRTRKS